MSHVRWFIETLMGFVIGIIFWPTTVKLLWKMYTNAGMDFREQAMIQTLKVQNADRGCMSRLKHEMAGFVIATALGLVFYIPVAIAGGILLLISLTELALRVEAQRF